MGTRVAPTYTNLYIGAFEGVHILSEHTFSSKIAIYRRFIDNLFFIWLGTEEEAMEFKDILNTNTWGIKFTANFKSKEIEFLDLNISVEKEIISTSTFFQKVYINRRSRKQTFPMASTGGIRKNCSNEEKYIEQAKMLKQRFKEKLSKGFEAFEKAK